ncbi:MAG: hypothetical protein ACRDXX_19480 [Stackebrandtia sp.]
MISAGPSAQPQRLSNPPPPPLVLRRAGGDELSGQFAGLGIEDKAEQTNAVAQRLEPEAAAQAEHLKSLLHEIRNQAEGLRGNGLQGAPRAGTPSITGISAQTVTSAPATRRLDSTPTGPNVINGRTYSIHSQERMADPTRNVLPVEVESAIAGGKNRAGRNPGTIEYYDADTQVHVVTSTAGAVVTVGRQSRTPGWAK